MTNVSGKTYTFQEGFIMEQCIFCGKDCRGGVNGITNHIQAKHPEKILPGETVVMGPDFRYMPKSMSDSFDDIIHDDDTPMVKAGKLRREKQRRIKYAIHRANLGLDKAVNEFIRDYKRLEREILED